MRKLLLLLLFTAPAFASKKSDRPVCATTYSILEKDTLGNVNQGANDKNLKWLQGDLEKKYPDVCYRPPSPAVTTVFVVTVEGSTYNGSRVVANTANSSGSVTNTTNGNTGTYTGTTTSYSAVPYSFDYGKYMLAVETLGAGDKVTVHHRFAQDGIYHTLYGVPLGGRGHHPEKALIEDAIKWIHNGGMEDSLQSAQ